MEGSLDELQVGELEDELCVQVEEKQRLQELGEEL